MDSELFNKIMDEISPDTLVEWYISTQRNLRNIHYKLRSFSIYSWQLISQMELSDDFIRKFQDKVDWNIISGSQLLNENFIEEFKDKIQWESVSRYQNFTEYFIRQYQGEMVWKCVS